MIRAMKSTRRFVLAIPAILLLLVSSVRAAEGRFEKEIQAYEAADQKQPPPKDAVLFIGSSTIRIWKSLPTDFPGITTINRGFGGSEIADSVRYADRIAIPYHPRRIVMYAGDNDLAAGKSPERVANDFRAFVEKVRSAEPDVPITFISIKPCPARWKNVANVKKANQLIADYAKSQKGIDFVDIFPAMLNSEGKPRTELFRKDGLHMNAKGYALWTSILAPRLKD